MKEMVTQSTFRNKASKASVIVLIHVHSIKKKNRTTGVENIHFSPQYLAPWNGPVRLNTVN